MPRQKGNRNNRIVESVYASDTESNIGAGVDRTEIMTALREVVAREGSELQIKVPNRPVIRVDGSLLPTGMAPIRPATAQQAVAAVAGLAKVELPLQTVKHAEFSFGVPDLGRFHAIVYRQRGSLALSVRRMSVEAPTCAELGISDHVSGLFAKPGLVVVCGGAQRKRAIAALVRYYNSTHRGLVVTVEDPIEFLHSDETAVIAQRGLGVDIDSVEQGISAAIRQGAEVLVVDHIPDFAATEALVLAAESGILVIAGSSAPDPKLASNTTWRHAPAHRQQEMKARVTAQIRGVVHVPDDGSARVLIRN